MNIQSQNSPQKTNFCAAFIRPQTASLFRKQAPNYYRNSLMNTNDVTDMITLIKKSWILSRKDKIKINAIITRLTNRAKDCLVSDKERKAIEKKLKRGKSASRGLSLIHNLVKNAQDMPDSIAEKAEKTMQRIRARAQKKIDAMQQSILKQN